MALVPEDGLPYQLISFFPLQNIICRCTTGMIRFMVLCGIGNRVECGGCQRLYYIKGMLPDGTCDIGIDIPPAKSLLVQ